MYSPQQLYQFINFAKQYLDQQGMQYKSGELLLDPNKEEDVNKLIAIALAEHRGNDGESTNIAGDSDKSRGPWQINYTVWEDTLRKYDIFEGYDDITEALDDPGLNAVAALIVAQAETGDERTSGINNWETILDTKINPTTEEVEIVQDDPFQIKSGTGEFVQMASNYNRNLIEQPTQVQDADGNITQITGELTPNIMQEEQQKSYPGNPMSIKNMSSMVKRASKGEAFLNREEYAHYSGNRVRTISGENINNMHKNLLANINVADMSNQEIINFYSKNIHPYIPYNATYGGVNMLGNGQNIIDMLQNTSANPKENYYVPGENTVISGMDVNKRINNLKSYMYQYFLNKKETEPLAQIESVYEYILRTSQPYIKVTDDFKVNNNNSTTPPPPNTRFPRRPQNNMTNQTPQAAPTFLNNLEKILKVKPSNNQGVTPKNTDAFFDMFGG
tara:strand:+ start:8526 stop:9866 length:1341 start_codon:yes stop_codon:yes gene_type:complete